MNAELDKALRVLHAGGVVACPTETFVALVADAFNPSAIDTVQRLKNRPQGLPIALLVPNIDSAQHMASLSLEALKLAHEFWPGPLTLVAKAKVELAAPLLSSGKVGLRVPAPSPALELVQVFGGPLTATSANRHGEPPLTEANELKEQAWTKQIEFLLPGVSPGGRPSTVVDVSAVPFKVIRQGDIVVPTL